MSEHVIAIGNQMAVIGPTNSLKCKLKEGTFKDVVVRYYMSLPCLSIESYLDLTKKVVQHFSANRHRKVSTTTMFNDKTIKFSHPNQELFVKLFQHNLRAGKFNKSLT